MLVHSKRKLLQAASIMAHQHHEKWDGSGYPWGLRGEGIHIFGRIVCLVDVFDALLSVRSYKEAWPLDRAVAWIEGQKGKHFDPFLVETLLAHIDEFVAIGECFGSNK